MDEPIRREITVAAAPGVVWDALTDPGELAAWFGAEAEVDLRVGGAVRFRWPDGTERRGVVIDVDPPRRLAFRWRELRASASGLAVADATVVAFTLDAEDDATRVIVMESSGVLAADPPLAMAENA
ncbi:MAG: SRPBCC family protein [Actinomycetota bacterium]